MANINPATTTTLEDFIEMRSIDEMTYYNFSILEVINGVEHLNHNLIEDYLEELKSACITVDLTLDQYKKYKYFPDLLSYDVYGSVQLDFIIMLLNDCIDPKEFDKKTVILPYARVSASFLNPVSSQEQLYIEPHRVQSGFTITL